MDLKITTSVCAAMVATLCATAQVNPGENLIVNGIFEADQATIPIFWGAPVEDAIRLEMAGGPGGKPLVRLCPVAGKREVSLRQEGLRLATNGTYRLTAWVRTKNFHAKSGSVGVANDGWQKGFSVGEFPTDTNGEWKQLSTEFTGFTSKDGTYFAYIYTVDQTNEGTLEVGDVRLEALDEAALKNTERSAQAKSQSNPRLLPLAPLLSQIPKADPVLTLQFFGHLPSGVLADYEAVLKTDDSEAESRAALAEKTFKMALPAGAKAGVLTLSVVRRSDGASIFSEQRLFGTRDLATVSTAGHRRLNNFVTELLSVPVSGQVTNRFSMVRDGWVYLAVKAIPGANFRVLLDGQEVIAADAKEGETFRRITAGAHEVVLEGEVEGRLVVRSVPELFNYCFANSVIAENPKYDWDYEKRYVLPAVTTEDGGWIGPKLAKELHATGREFVDNIGSTGASAEEIVKRMMKAKGTNDANFDGVALDEQTFARPAWNESFTAGVKAYDLARRPTHTFYSWIAGKPSLPAIDHDYIVSCINASQGRGKILYEAYLGTQETEAAARQAIQVAIVDRVAAFRELVPISVPSVGVVLGNFNQMPVISIAHHPDVDYKYFLDLQLSSLANDPDCRDLGLTGYWGSYYADDEIHRWSFALLRHYCVEGHTEILSKRYGYTYRPDHILNGDFRRALESWTTNGNVRPDAQRDFGEKSEGRWYSHNVSGDDFAVLVREEGKVASIAQTAKGLVPGKRYCLQFATFDVKDVKANVVNPRRFGIGLSAALLEGAEVDRSLSWVHVDKRIKGRYKRNDGVARINLHHIVFTARATELPIVISNAKAAVGEELGVNFISLNPYYGAENE